jgi:hypothetical protein
MTTVDRGRKLMLKAEFLKAEIWRSAKIWEVEGKILKADAGVYPVHTTGGMPKSVIAE